MNVKKEDGRDLLQNSWLSINSAILLTAARVLRMQSTAIVNPFQISVENPAHQGSNR